MVVEYHPYLPHHFQSHQTRLHLHLRLQTLQGLWRVMGELGVYRTYLQGKEREMLIGEY